VIGQACEFNYSGTQACRVLRAEGIRVSLVNSNPATIMTDPEFADATYVEPITTEVLEKVIAIERPDAVLPTMGGQTALNAAVALHESGVLARHGVELIGATIDTIKAGEDRSAFKQIVTGLGAQVPASTVCHSLEECEQAAGELGYPVVIRPSFTLGGAGSGIAHDPAGLRRIAVVRAVGVDTGGCNIQFAVHPQTGRMVVIEMNPRVSRSSALASKATGF